VAGGDHTIVICLVEDAEIGSGDRLLYYARGYCTPLRLALRPTGQFGGKRRAGANADTY